MSGYSERCEACGGTTWTVVHPRVFGFPGNLVRCGACGLKFYDAPPPQDFWEHHNSEAYDALADATATCGSMCNRDPAQADDARRWVREYYERLVGRLQAYAPGLLHRVFEVGCGVGAFLSVARAMGVEHLAGCDPSRRSVELTRLAVPGAALEHSFLADARRPEDMDAVVMLDVIEHTATPRGDLERALAMLRPGGILLLKTFFDEWHATIPLDLSAARRADRGLRTTGYFCPISHPHHFDLPVLLALVERVGFRIEETQRDEAYGQVTVFASKPLDG